MRRKFDSVEEWLENYKNVSFLKGFHPTAIEKDVEGVTLEEIIKICDKWCEDGKLIKKYKLICPNCFHLLNTYPDKDSIPEETECIWCGEEIEKEYMDVFPVMYEFKR